MSALYATAIYGLADPRTQELRYVGKTTQTLSARLRMHLKDAQNIPRRHVCTWIRSLLRDDHQPEIFEIEQVGDDWAKQEQFWIAYFRSIGSRLTNETQGGEGMPGKRHSPETRAKMSAIARVKHADPAVRQRKSEALKLVHADPAKKARITQGIRDAFKRPEVIANSNAARLRPDVMARRVASIKARYEAEPWRRKRRGQAISEGKLKPENRAKAAESQRLRHINNPLSAEARARLSEHFKGRVFSEETRRKMSESAKNRRKKVQN